MENKEEERASATRDGVLGSAHPPPGHKHKERGQTHQDHRKQRHRQAPTEYHLALEGGRALQRNEEW